MQVLRANEPPFTNSTSGADWFPKPQPVTMTIAAINTYPRAPTMRRFSSAGSNPMMCVTLPKEMTDDPLASPVNSKPLPSFSSNANSAAHGGLPPLAPPPLEPSSSSPNAPLSFGNVFTRRRQASIEKKPPMAPTPPSLRRTTSAPLAASRLVSKISPMLMRVVSGGTGRTQAADQDEDDEDDAANARESLLMLIRVPEMRRHSDRPLMMSSHLDY